MSLANAKYFYTFLGPEHYPIAIDRLTILGELDDDSNLVSVVYKILLDHSLFNILQTLWEVAQKTHT